MITKPFYLNSRFFLFSSCNFSNCCIRYSSCNFSNSSIRSSSCHFSKSLLRYSSWSFSLSNNSVRTQRWFNRSILKLSVDPLPLIASYPYHFQISAYLSTVQEHLQRFYSELETGLSSQSSQSPVSSSSRYQSDVIKLLHGAKARFPLSEDELRYLQFKIESITMFYDEESIFKSCQNLLRILIRNEEKSAKDILRESLKSQEDLELISEFGAYTVEGLIVYEVGRLFNTIDKTLMIRLATLISQLERSVRTQAFLLRSRRFKTEFSIAQKESDTKRSKKPIGTCLIELMLERGMITLINEKKDQVQMKKGSYYNQSNLYAICNFDLTLLPVRLNLPMVSKPIDWTPPIDSVPLTLSDLSGGYLSAPTGEIYDRYRLLSSHDQSHFTIDISPNGGNSPKLCEVINKLQGQAFQINSDWLEYLKSNGKWFVEQGLLKPRFLHTLNINEVSKLLREFYMKDEVLKQSCSYSQMLNTVCKDIQCSRYEDFILKLASAYEGYHFYLPAFLDFRGRIYRCGILHFHERDLARSLILFAGPQNALNAQDQCNLSVSSAFHYSKFPTSKEALDWFLAHSSQIMKNPFKYVLEAKRPFQFFANMIGLERNKMEVLSQIPITQDASASAYQIMSYFMLDETMAKRTNLIPTSEGQIQDVYENFLEELKETLKVELDQSLSEIVCGRINRKLVKGIFMPKIYGKTFKSTADNLHEHLSHYITYKESLLVAKACFKFWSERYPGMECLIRLIRNIGMLASARDRPVLSQVPYFTTVQDYLIMEPINLWVYDRLHKKRHKVTLRVSSYKRDRRKTNISTFANFIHQKDASIAMMVVEKMLSSQAPIYTVHDNFLTTASYSNRIPILYGKVICEMGPPLSIINEFIYLNVIQPIEGSGYFVREVISQEKLHSYLKAYVPDNISKKMTATWNEKISVILTSYEDYTRHVGNSWQSHEQKWDEFQFKLIIEEGMEYYSVHY